MNTLVNEKQNVKKHVGAIHIGANLTLVQRKSINVLLAHAYENLLTERTHSIPIRALALLIGFDSKNEEYLRNALRRLTSVSVEWDSLNAKGKKEWVTSAILSHAKIVDGSCEYSYSEELAKKLYNPEVYQQINLKIQKNFTSAPALALYENCLRYRKLGKTGWIDLDTFRHLMGVKGKQNYKAFRRLNDKIIKPAVKQIKQCSEIIVESEFKKKGRKVEAVRFLIRENPQMSLLEMTEDDEIKQTEAFKKLRGFGISDRLAYQWIYEHGEEYVVHKITYTEDQEKAGKITGKASGFLTKAVSEDWKTEKEVRTVEGKKIKAKREKKATKKAQLRAMQTAVVDIEKAHNARINEFIVAEIDKMKPTEIEILETEFTKTLNSESTRRDFYKIGWKSRISMTRIIDFWAKRAPSEFPTIETVAQAKGIDDWRAFREELNTLAKIA